MVVFSPTVNAAGSDAATTTSEAVTGQVRNDLGLCLTIPGDTTQEGTQAVISQCSSSSPSQRWSLPSPTGK